jgi:hypothetical protein
MFGRGGEEQGASKRGVRGHVWGGGEQGASKGGVRGHVWGGGAV